MFGQICDSSSFNARKSFWSSRSSSSETIASAGHSGSHSAQSIHSSGLGGYEVLIVDDGSPDGTADVVRKLMDVHGGRIHLEERTGKLGLGTAYIHGFKWALAREYAHVFEMDCDFSHKPEDLPRLLEACENGADVSIGSRYVQGVNVVNWPMSRVLLSYFASVYVRFITGMPIQDATAGFKCYTRETLAAIDFSKNPFCRLRFPD